MPMLQRGSRRPAQSHAGTPAASRSTASAPAELPPYEPPMYPLDNESKQLLAALSDSHHTHKLEHHIKRSMEFLQASVVSLNDRARTRREQAESVAAKRQKTNNAEEDGEEENRMAEFGAKVARLTEEHEAAFRELIDFRNELEDRKDVIKTMREEVDAQQVKVRAPQNRPKRERTQRRRDGSEDEEDEEEEEEESDAHHDLTPYVGASDLLKKARQAKGKDYFRMSAEQRYAKDNSYIEFRKLLHDAVNSGEVPVPHASKWFDKEDNPVLSVQNGVEADDDDDEIAVQKEVLDTRCPLSGSFMKVPMTSKVCKHTFEEEHILSFIAQGRGQAKCPVCNRTMIKQDLYHDKVMLRYIKRQEARQNQDDSDDDKAEAIPNDEDADEFMDIREASHVKGESETDDIED